MNQPNIVQYHRQWYLCLQEAITKAIQEAYDGRWNYSLTGDKGLSADITGREGEFTIQNIQFAEERGELIIYGQVGKAFTTERESLSCYFLRKMNKHSLTS